MFKKPMILHIGGGIYLKLLLLLFFKFFFLEAGLIDSSHLIYFDFNRSLDLYQTRQ